MIFTGIFNIILLLCRYDISFFLMRNIVFLQFLCQINLPVPVINQSSLHANLLLLRKIKRYLGKPILATDPNFNISSGFWADNYRRWHGSVGRAHRSHHGARSRARAMRDEARRKRSKQQVQTPPRAAVCRLRT